MLDTAQTSRQSLMPFSNELQIKYLMPGEIQALTNAWNTWYDEASTVFKRRMRGRYYLTYLTLRHTGARLGEVLKIRDDRDINHNEAEIRLATLKRKTDLKRLVPVVPDLIREIDTFLEEFPGCKGSIFSLDPSNFRGWFYEMAKRAGILSEEYVNGKKDVFPHPHTLRHTRAIELLSAGVPVTAVRDLLGHSSLVTTAEYLRLSGQDVKNALRSRGL